MVSKKELYNGLLKFEAKMKGVSLQKKLVHYSAQIWGILLILTEY